MLKQIRELPKSKRMIMQTALMLVQSDIEQSEELLREVPTNNESGAYLQALHCLKKGDRKAFEHHLQTVKSPTHKQVLLAESSFCEGDFESAHRYGEQALFLAKGLECYLMIKFLERSEALGEQRTSYF